MISMPISKAAKNALVSVLLLCLLASCDDRGRYLEKACGLPALPAEKKELYDYYRLKFLPDGYPGKKIGGGTVPHPIYGTYVIEDYLGLYSNTRDKAYLAAAEKVARSAIDRMETYNGALVFWYLPGSGLTDWPNRFYSALTQSHYLKLFYRLYALTGDKVFKEASLKVLESLFIRVEDGGVLKKFSKGVTLEEYPHSIPTFVLNGWLTALVNLKIFIDASGSSKARRLFEENISTLDRMLDLYDFEEVANSRYQLTNHVWLRVSSSTDTRTWILKAAVEIPKEGTFQVFSEKGSRWLNFFEGTPDKDGGLSVSKDTQQRINVLLSMVSYPKPNVIKLSLRSEFPSRVEISIQKGNYDPLASAVEGDEWVRVASYAIKAGDNEINVVIPWDEARYVAYPTNFAKKVGGKRYNSYHFIHIQRLRELYKFTGISKFERYASKWEKYAEKWGNIAAYRDKKLEFKPRTDFSLK